MAALSRSSGKAQLTRISNSAHGFAPPENESICSYLS